MNKVSRQLDKHISFDCIMIGSFGMGVKAMMTKGRIVWPNQLWTRVRHKFVAILQKEILLPENGHLLREDDYNDVDDGSEKKKKKKMGNEKR